MWVLNEWVGQVGGWSSGVGGQVGVWSKCVSVVKVCGQSVCMCVWPKCVQGSSGWVVIWVAGQVGVGGVKWVGGGSHGVGGEVGVWPKYVCVVKVRGQSVCMCLWPK